MELFRSHDGDGAASARALLVATLFPQHLGFKKRFVSVVLRSRHALIERVLVSSPCQYCSRVEQSPVSVQRRQDDDGE
jgi:hypothetical protein